MVYHLDFGPMDPVWLVGWTQQHGSGLQAFSSVSVLHRVCHQTSPALRFQHAQTAWSPIWTVPRASMQDQSSVALPAAQSPRWNWQALDTAQGAGMGCTLCIAPHQTTPMCWLWHSSIQPTDQPSYPHLGCGDE